VFTRRDDRLVEMIGRSADPRVRAASLSVMSAVFSRNFPSTGYRVGCVTTMVDKADIYGCRRFKRHIAGRPEFVDRTHDVGNIKEVLDLTRPAAFDSCWMYTGMLDDLSENKAPLAFCSRDGRWPLEVLKHYVGVYATGIGGEKVVFELREGALAEFV